MLALEVLADQKIREAIERGELDELPGENRYFRQVVGKLDR
jgi:hypothetical protein